MTGQIIKRGENTWYVRIFLGRDANGKRKCFNKTIHGIGKSLLNFRKKIQINIHGLPFISFLFIRTLGRLSANS
jgi:hypothetical protein